jgi:hypothetical protein
MRVISLKLLHFYSYELNRAVLHTERVQEILILSGKLLTEIREKPCANIQVTKTTPNSLFYISYVHTFLYLQFFYSLISCIGNMLPSPNWLQKWLCATVKRRYTVTVLGLQVHALLWASFQEQNPLTWQSWCLSWNNIIKYTVNLQS